MLHSFLTPLNSNSVRSVLNDILGIDIAVSGPYLDGLGRVYAAFLGANDELAMLKLDRFYHRLLQLVKDTTHRANLVDEVASRNGLTERAVEVLYGWLSIPEASTPESTAISATPWKEPRRNSPVG